jgi:membrane fusion protein (multidrug efflux system)
MKTSTRATKENATQNLFLALLISLSLFVSACSDTGATDDGAKTEDSAEGDSKEKKKDEKPPVPVEVVSVSRGNIQQTYRTITTLEADQNAQVVARSTGLLQKLYVEEGDYVEQGQIMAQLDVELLSLEVAQLSATSKKLNKELERQQSLFKRRLASSDALDRAKFEYQSQSAQLKLSKLKLNYASIKAPISGMITERLVTQGNLIRDNDILFKIVDPSSLKAVLHLPEKELSNIRLNQLVLLSVDALNNQVIQGSIERIRPSIDTTTGTFRVVAKLNNTELLLQSGMFGKVEVVFDVHPNTLLLEQQAVITQDNRSHVFVVKDEKAIQTPIRIGFRHNGVLEIIEGLNEADQVITTGQQILKHEAKVEIIGLENDEVVKKPEPKKQEQSAASSIAVASNS